MRSEIQALLDSNAELDITVVQEVFASSPLNATLNADGTAPASIKEIEWPTQIEICATYNGQSYSSCYDKFVEGNDQVSDDAFKLARTNAFIGHLVDLSRAEG